MSYDTGCDALARKFLSDVVREPDGALVAALAQAIQDAIEEFLADKGLT